MFYNELFKDINIIKSNISDNIEITDLVADSRKVKKGSVFVCIKGARTDAHTLIPQAIVDGAVLCVVQKDTEVELDGINYVMVNDTREAFALLLANFYGNPQKSFKYVIGVTGTNGKSSTTFMLKHILEQAGYKVGLIGTLKYMIGDREYVTDKSGNVLTTPDSELLFELMSKMREENVDCLVMEVSSHAIALNKICGMRFNIGIFTNLSRDHLDFHSTMEEYRDTKARLFENCDIGIINNDDLQAEVMKSRCGEVYTYAIRNLKSDFMAKNIRSKGAAGTEYELLTNDSIFRIKLPIPGDFSVYNSLAATSCAYIMGVQSSVIASAMETMPGVPGRICKLDTGTPFSVIIDFAHTPDGLQNILNTIKGFKGSGRVITLFGCGGDRDKTKRPLMGKVAMLNSDYCIITSDNSRSEEKSDIIKDILAGIKGIKTPYTVIENRMQAIEYAIDMAKPDDIILLAGKGHEEYEIDKTGKHPYSETEIVMRKVGKL